MMSRLSTLALGGRKRFDDLGEQEILALAIGSEEKDGAVEKARETADGGREHRRGTRRVRIILVALVMPLASQSGACGDSAY